MAALTMQAKRNVNCARIRFTCCSKEFAIHMVVSNLVKIYNALAAIQKQVFFCNKVNVSSPTAFMQAEMDVIFVNKEEYG